MLTIPYTIRPMTRSELDLAVSWAAREGWNPGLGDATCFHAADPEGFLVGLLGEEPIATLSAVRWGAGFGFIGFYIVHPDHRGKGYGWRIWRAGMRVLEGRCIGLDGVLAQQESYRKSGFALAWRNVRYQGVAPAGGLPGTDADVVPLDQRAVAEVLAYDRPFFPDDRADFMTQWIRQPGAVSLGILQQGVLAGFGVLRPCQSGFKVGPLCADTPALAARLLDALAGHVPAGMPWSLDAPEPNADARALATQRGMTPIFETARMYTGPVPDMPLQRLYGVTSFELG